MAGDITDKVVPWEVKQQCNLINAIFSQVVNHHVQELRTKKCCGCEVNHPSQRRHDCIMMTDEEGWLTNGFTQFKADLSEYQDILGYLHYWKNEH